MQEAHTTQEEPSVWLPYLDTCASQYFDVCDGSEVQGYGGLALCSPVICGMSMFLFGDFHMQ